MLVAVQTSGAKAPLYFIHGLVGLMTLGRFLARSLDPDRPLYTVNANGIDGRDPAAGTVKDMARSYADEIVGVQPSGHLIIAGMCSGALAALEVARELKAGGREVGPVIVADPPMGPPGNLRHNQTVDRHDPRVFAQLYQRTRGQILQFASAPDHELPFAADDEAQLHAATLAGVSSLVALCTHVPEVFPGEVAAILSLQRAVAFFHPRMDWVRLLPRRRVTHVLPCTHDEMFRSSRHDFARILKFVLDDAANFRFQCDAAAGAALASV